MSGSLTFFEVGRIWYGDIVHACGGPYTRTNPKERRMLDLDPGAQGFRLFCVISVHTNFHSNILVLRSLSLFDHPRLRTFSSDELDLSPAFEGTRGRHHRRIEQLPQFLGSRCRLHFTKAAMDGGLRYASTTSVRRLLSRFRLQASRLPTNPLPVHQTRRTHIHRP